MDKKFEITILAPEQKGIRFTSVKNKFGTWNATLDFDWGRSSHHESKVYIVLNRSNKIEPKVFDKIKVTTTSSDVSMDILANDQSIILELSGGRSQYQTYFIDATELPFDSMHVEVSKDTSKSYLEELLETGKLADITIKTMDQKEVKAHSWMLSRSKVFDAMLNEHDTKESREKIITIEDVEHDLMKEFLRFLYCDKIPKLEEMAKDLLALGDRYGIPELVKSCGVYLIESGDLESIADVLIPADNMGLSDLKKLTIEFIFRNRSKLSSTESWKQLKETHKNLVIDIMEPFYFGDM